MLSSLIEQAINQYQKGLYEKKEISPKGISTFFSIPFTPSPITDEDTLYNEAAKFLLYSWSITHGKRTHELFEYLYIPNDVVYNNIKNVSFQELLYFISPQTEKTNDK